MSLITCDNDCVYQKEGYCILETPTVINNKSDYQKCVHYVKTRSNDRLNDTPFCTTCS